jgi:hypothetical protein
VHNGSLSNKAHARHLHPEQALFAPFLMHGGRAQRMVECIQFWFNSEAERQGKRKYCLHIRYQR